MVFHIKILFFQIYFPITISQYTTTDSTRRWSMESAEVGETLRPLGHVRGARATGWRTMADGRFFAVSETPSRTFFALKKHFRNADVSRVFTDLYYTYIFRYDVWWNSKQFEHVRLAEVLS